MFQMKGRMYGQWKVSSLIIDDGPDVCADVAELRTKHRICGTLSGTLPHLTQQNFFLGLPLLLMPEEVVLLVENGAGASISYRSVYTDVTGVATIVHDHDGAFQPPSAEELSAWDKSMQDDIDQQRSAWYAREKARQTPQQGEAALQKRRERAERRQQEESERHAADDAPPRPATYTIQIPRTSHAHPWYRPTRYDDLASAKQAGVWPYPSTRLERASCRVFRDLWERGYFLGSGLKFGGEFLVYPGQPHSLSVSHSHPDHVKGDPLRYHSHFVASVIESPSTVIRPMEIVAHGRLGTATKKAHLLCGWDEHAQRVTYFSIEWAGFG